MTIKLVPISANRIDVSGITDIERERLKVTFKDGRELYFLYDPHSTSIVVDVDPFKTGLGDARRLNKELFERFRVRYARNRMKRLVDGLHKFFDPNFHVPFDRWTIDRLFSEFRIELGLGNEVRDCGLAVGVHLWVTYGTRYSDPIPDFIPWGKVESIESVMLEPTPVNLAVRNYA